MRMLRVILLVFVFTTGYLKFEAEAQTGTTNQAESKLVAREFKVNVASLTRGLDEMGVSGSTNLQDRLEALFRAAGVVVPTNGVNGNYVMLNTSNGVLRVKATKEDMEIVQAAMEILDFDSLLVQLEVKHIEVEYIDQEERFEAGRFGQPVFKAFTGEMAAATNAPWLDESLKASFFTNKNVTVEGLFLPNQVRVLSAQEYKIMTRQLEQSDRVDLMAQPRSSTVSGRTSAGGLRCDLAKGVFLYPSADAMFPRLEDMASQAGVVIATQVRPFVDASGENLRVDWVTDVIQIVNHQSRPASAVSLTRLNAPVPDYRVRQVTGSNQIKDGETLMIGCGMVEKVVKGRKGEPDQKRRFVTIMMLTATVFDREGEPVGKKEK